MRKVNYKGRCEKRVLSKCKTVFKSYDPIQNAYANILESSGEITGGDNIHAEFKGQQSFMYKLCKVTLEHWRLILSEFDDIVWRAIQYLT